jgi:putative flavoprotein involved in K+ transport
MIQKYDTIVIGAGQAGLATSYCLTHQNRRHLILEKNRIGESWRSGKWDSFTLVMPNWALRLPGFEYQGDNPDGFLKRVEVVKYLEDYAKKFDLPVRTGIEVFSVKEAEGAPGFSLKTSDGAFAASNVVVATGTFQKPKIPAFSSQLASHYNQIHSSRYRNPDQLPTGTVLVVGSAQSGCQIADELNRSGRQVYLSTGAADRIPRRYRGKDCFWWMEKAGILDQQAEELPSPGARFKPNPQVTGRDGGQSLNLHILAQHGVTLLGRIKNFSGSTAHFAEDLTDNLAQADEFATEFQQAVDMLIEKAGMQAPREEIAEDRAGYDMQPIADLDLDDAGIKTIIWATGYTFDYSWIDFPIYDETGYPVQQRGVTEKPGLYFVGLNWLHTRKSGLLYGVGEDAAYVANHLAKRDEANGS